MSLAIAIFLAAFTSEVKSQCTQNSIGTVECVLLTPYYSEPQWATCLTHQYIQQKSNQRHICRGYAPICWYQCQLEVHGNENGAVFDDCRCSMDEEVPDRDLDQSCYSPSGDSCSWYRQCLAERYSECIGTEDDYAIKFAEKFCNLYNTIEVSETGNRWVNAVRKCLQVALVPLLRPWVDETCSGIRARAFQSHPQCYLQPEPQAPSICDLPIGDCLKIFWLIFNNLEFDSAIVETGSQMLQVAGGCIQQNGINKAKVGATVLMSIPAVRLVRISASIAIKVGTYLADKLGFNDKKVSWFPVVPDEPDTTNSPLQRRNADSAEPNLNITLLLVSLDSLGITTQETGRTYEIEEVVEEIADAVRNGQLSNIPISDQVSVGISSVGECADLLCSEGTNVTTLAVSSGANMHLSFIGIVLCVLHTVYVAYYDNA